jgi:hypothetical protein
MKKPSKEVKLEERIECVLCTQELELDGNAWKGKYELNDFGSIKDFIAKKLRRLNKRGEPEPYMNQSTGDKIIISGESARKLTNNFDIDKLAYQKIIAHIPQIIEQMQFLEKMPADKANAKFKEYSYYITPVKIDGETYTIFSEVGKAGKETYYDQNMFKGTPKEVLGKAKEETSEKYSRLNKILQNAKGGDWNSGSSSLYLGDTPTAQEDN